MERFENLEKKVHKVAEQLIALRHEKQKLQAEIKFLLDENQRVQQLASENEALRSERRSVSSRIEKLVKKINAIAS